MAETCNDNFFFQRPVAPCGEGLYIKVPNGYDESQIGVYITAAKKPSLDVALEVNDGWVLLESNQCPEGYFSKAGGPYKILFVDQHIEPITFSAIDGKKYYEALFTFSSFGSTGPTYLNFIDNSTPPEVTP